MNENFLKLAYQSLKRQFNGISKNSWIWVDFFEDEKVSAFSRPPFELNVTVKPSSKYAYKVWSPI